MSADPVLAEQAGGEVAAERGEFDTASPRRRQKLEFESVQEALKAQRKPR